MARIIGEVRPRYAFVENSPMLTSRGLGTVLGDLAALGFDARWGVISAADVGAPHLRERIWIVAKFPDADGDGFDFILQRQGGRKRKTQCATVSLSNQWGSDNRQSLGNSGQIEGNGDAVCGRETAEISNNNSDSQSTGAIHAEQVCKSDIPDTVSDRRNREIGGKGGNGWFGFHGQDEQMADADAQRLQGNAGSRGARTKGKSDGHFAKCDWWPPEPDVGRVANGVAARVDRLKAIGNGQVPRVAATAFKLLAGKF